jgi:hypothetical protein
MRLRPNIGKGVNRYASTIGRGAAARLGPNIDCQYWICFNSYRNYYETWAKHRVSSVNIQYASIPIENFMRLGPTHHRMSIDMLQQASTTRMSLFPITTIKRPTNYSQYSNTG